ncbi:glutamate racemase [Celerinatantimonas diazotrophica]|uniref:Glutamate racemase n=1 Tax=Celerinatantimonas diazotrophica TaxID=412034 RepID=A0A4R1K7K9_9GAMM|nr:glutamate racemase [Celerinatantimonas diazotrophica]TCK59783.1 glutamate racemase [Celerinatantimonas diazotrophica]CAG9295535.1 Glutamate racemase [Celerinatantimonas diazotrophica]
MTPHLAVFDSGVGGLSIVRSLDSQLGSYQLSYLFDNALFPYGELNEATLVARVLDLVVPFCQQQRPDLLVIACNTASTVVLKPLRQMLSIPVVGVVPAIKPACQISKSKIIGLLATPATIQRCYTKQLIERFSNHCLVLKIGSTKLVELAEQKLSGDCIQIQTRLRPILSAWLDGDVQPDVVVLGCTHFPLLRDELHQVLGDKVCLVDSGQAVAQRVASLLNIKQTGCYKMGARVGYFTQKNAHTDLLWASFKALRFSELNPLENDLCAHWPDELLMSDVESLAH